MDSVRCVLCFLLFPLISSQPHSKRQPLFSLLINTVYLPCYTYILRTLHLRTYPSVVHSPFSCAHLHWLPKDARAR
ncbi:hypothetical protein BGX38DRAFT_1204609 [Terfezia claveryi]|nr:hypothetical protein BGX38DRAFT_1204609 [Terfezia claveryi]